MPMRLLHFVQKSEEVEKTTLFNWRPQGNYLAFKNGSFVKIIDHYGELFDQFVADEKDNLLDWHKNGEYLAIVGRKVPQVTLYTMSTKEIKTIDLGLATKEWPTLSLWSDLDVTLIVCTNRGNLFFLNVLTSRKTPIIGKHQKAITTGTFNSEGLLALGSEDATITINNVSGDTINSFGCNAEPESLYYISMCDQFDKNKKEFFVAAVLNKKTLMVSHATSTEAPVNLQFQEKYGNIRKCCWFEKGQVLIAFETGYIVCLSVNRQPEQSQEIFSIKDYDHYLSDLVVCQNAKMAISIGDNCIKIRQLDRLSELSSLVTVDEDSMGLDKVKSNNTGNLLAVSGKSGTIMIFLTKIPMIGSAYQDRIVWLNSINEITITFDGDIPPLNIEVKIEPNQLAINNNYVAVVSNNKIWFYEYIGRQVISVKDMEYLSTVKKIKLNSCFVMALQTNTVQLHKITATSTDNVHGESIIFPHNGTTIEYNLIIDADITEKFFIFCTDSNQICYFSLNDWTLLLNFKHYCSVQKIIAENNDIRLCFFDQKHDAYIFCPSLYQSMKVPSNDSSYSDCLWENFTIDKNTFALIAGQELYVFMLSKKINELSIDKIGSTPIPYGHIPMMMTKGIIYCMTQSGKINTFILNSQKTETNLEGKTSTDLENLLKQQVKIKRWRNAWKICEQSKTGKLWDHLAEEALKNNMFQLAIRVYKHTNNVAMVWTIEELMILEDQVLTKANINMLMNKYDDAQTWFISSSDKELGLKMRRDILHWDRAAELAETINPHAIPYIAKEYANQLEFLGDYNKALKNYELAIIKNIEESDPVDSILDHNEYCENGIARMAIKIGDINRGITIAQNNPNRNIKKECGILLEQIKQYNEAGKLFELGYFYERAAAAYIKSKNWNKIKELGNKIKSAKILTQYGKILEMERKYSEALKVYMNASNYDMAVKIMVEELNMIEDAVKLVRESKSNEGAKIISKYFNKVGETALAVEFLVISKCYQEAFQLAEIENLMNVFANVVEAQKISQQYDVLIKYYSSQHHDNFMIGKFSYLNNEYKKALSALLSAKDDEKTMPIAIQCAVESKDTEIFEELTSYLLGDKDGIPKDPNYIFRLYVEMKMYPEAAKTAMILCAEEQKRGNYKIARDLLFQMQKQLIDNNLYVSISMIDALTLLHSYLLVKSLIKRNEIKTAAKILIRVSNNINLFPSNTVDILTSTVILCAKTGLNASAFKFAVQLLRPELKKYIAIKYRKKIETIVRKAKNTNDEEESKTPCPLCNENIPESSLTCQFCKQKIPMCIITGKHIVINDFALCNNCNFPGYFSYFKKLAANNERCPMCNSLVNDVIPSNANLFIQNQYYYK